MGLKPWLLRTWWTVFGPSRESRRKESVLICPSANRMHWKPSAGSPGGRSQQKEGGGYGGPFGRKEGEVVVVEKKERKTKKKVRKNTPRLQTVGSSRGASWRMGSMEEWMAHIRTDSDGLCAASPCIQGPKAAIYQSKTAKHDTECTSPPQKHNKKRPPSTSPQETCSQSLRGGPPSLPKNPSVYSSVVHSVLTAFKPPSSDYRQRPTPIGKPCQAIAAPGRRRAPRQWPVC